MTLIEQGRIGRPGAEAFIEARFRAAFGARLRSHYPTIAALVGADGEIRAAAGIRLAENEPLFLERYLDAPVEQALAAAFERPVARDGVVEIGGFAAADVAAALDLFAGLAMWLADPCRRRFAVVTARPELERLLRRAGFGPRALAAADPARMGPAIADWGSYYGSGPRVYGGQIGASAVLPLLSQRLQARSDRRLRRAAS